jgi:hypothetical protein
MQQKTDKNPQIPGDGACPPWGHPLGCCQDPDTGKDASSFDFSNTEDGMALKSPLIFLFNFSSSQSLPSSILSNPC